MNLIYIYNYYFSKSILQKIKIPFLSALFTIFSFNVFSQTTSFISNCNDFVSGPNAWPYVLVATTIADGAASQAAQTFTMNVTDTANGASVRVFKTTANGSSFFGNPVALALGSNSITVPAVAFDRAVKFQFSSGAVEFDALSLNGVNSTCIGVLPPPPTSLISDCGEFVSGPAAWPYVLVATTVADGAASQAAQTFTMNVTDTANGASVRVFKTTANGSSFFGNPVALALGSNSITVPPVAFDRAVKFQFSSGAVEFDALSLNGVNSTCVVAPPPSVPGCTDSTAINYDPLATTDDGSCVYPPPTSSLISDCDDFLVGSNSNWPYVLTATTLDSGLVSQEAQTFTMNVTSLPTAGANFRVYKTTANGNSFLGNPVALTLGSNSITVAAVNFDRAVKFQFSSGDVEFDALNLNGVASECVANATSTEMPEHNVFLITFPNPSNGDLFIKSNDPIKLIEIKDLSGRVVLQKNPQKTKVHIQTSQLKNSFYFLSCLIEQQWVTRKIIIN